MPQDDAAWRAALEAAATATQPIPPALGEQLATRQRALGAGEQAEANARALAGDRPRTVAVVTGQQPGLLGGPLLTFHKAAGAIALARRLDALRDDVHVVPVFWLASEDHDLDEANQVDVIDAQGQPRRLKLDAEADGRSLADVDVPAAAREALLAELASLLPDTERARAAVELARTHAGERFDTWCVRVLVAVFGNTGLVVVEPDQLDPYVAPTYSWLLDHAVAIGRAVRKTGKRLAGAGLPAPLAPGSGATPLFYRKEPGGPRLRVTLGTGGAVYLRDDEAGFDLDALKRRLGEDPRRGAGNVIGRVFVQNRHLPVLAYVAGPTEIAYQAQLAAAAAELGARFPLALPRPEATWVHDRDGRTAEDFDLTLGAVLRGVDPPAPPIEPELAAAEARARQALTGVAAGARELEALGGQTRDALRRLEARLAAAFDKAWPGVAKAAAADLGVGRHRLQRLRAAVRPADKPQERVLSPLSLIARHGLDAVRTGLLSLDPLVPAHQVVWIGEENATS